MVNDSLFRRSVSSSLGSAAGDLWTALFSKFPKEIVAKSAKDTAGKAAVTGTIGRKAGKTVAAELKRINLQEEDPEKTKNARRNAIGKKSGRGNRSKGLDVVAEIAKLGKKAEPALGQEAQESEYANERKILADNISDVKKYAEVVDKIFNIKFAIKTEAKAEAKAIVKARKEAKGFWNVVANVFAPSEAKLTNKLYQEKEAKLTNEVKQSLKDFGINFTLNEYELAESFSQRLGVEKINPKDFLQVLYEVNFGSDISNISIGKEFVHAIPSKEQKESATSKGVVASRVASWEKRIKSESPQPLSRNDSLVSIASLSASAKEAVYRPLSELNKEKTKAGKDIPVPLGKNSPAYFDANDEVSKQAKQIVREEAKKPATSKDGGASFAALVKARKENGNSR